MIPAPDHVRSTVALRTDTGVSGDLIESRFEAIQYHSDPLLETTSIPGGATARLEGTALTEWVSVLVLGGGYHHVAAYGIVLLLVVAVALFLRNRLIERANEPYSREPPESEDVLTDRELIHTLVRENGGRMKQAEIVDSVEWSKAKVSRLLADLEEEGEITKLRLGRENLICLAGNEPAASQSDRQQPE